MIYREYCILIKINQIIYCEILHLIIIIINSLFTFILNYHFIVKDIIVKIFH